MKNNAKKLTVAVGNMLAAAVLGMAATAGAAAEVVTSPNEQIAVTITVEKGLGWEVMRKGKSVTLSSPIGLSFKGQKPFGAFEVVAKEERGIDTVWTNRLYKKALVRDCANELTLHLREKDAPKRLLDVVVRAYDGGVALRYGIPAQPGFELFTLAKDCTTWRFPGDPLAWLTVYGDYKTSQECPFLHRSLRSAIGEKTLVGMPAVIELNGQMAALCEADLTDWAGCFFRVPAAQRADATLVEAALSPIPDTDGDLVISPAPRLTPWRVIVLGDNELELLANNDIILNLNPPPEGGDAAFSWVKPGATSWDWWAESNNSLSTELTLKLVDFAAEMGWPYHTIDGGWYGYARRPNHGPGVKIFPRAGFDLDRILKHAKEKGVGIWVWCYWSVLEENGVDKVFADFERRGIKGVKIDFMDRQDQWMVRWYEKVVRCAAKHKLMINFHGAFKPTGMNRTWPNQITREGILGNEMTKFTHNVSAAHTATLPFTRYLLGPADFTPGSFGNVHSAEFVPQGRKGHRYGDESDRRQILAEEIGTRAHALALCVAYDSPLMTLCDWPQRYRNAPGIEALRALPTVWRNTLPLAGKVGRYYSVVRETYDGRLYLAILGVGGASFELPLAFLPEGTSWKATFYTDGPNAAQDARDLSITTRTVTRESKVTLTVAPEGGAVVIFAPAEAK